MFRTVICAATLAAASSAFATEQLFSTGWSNWTTVQSKVCNDMPALSQEAADDFELVANIERIVVNGNNGCGAVCFPPPLSAAHVRFYEWTPRGPGALQKEFTVLGADPNLAYDSENIEDVEVTLVPPFVATGKHYVSVQLEFDECFWWGYWVANPNQPIGGAAYQRGPNGAWIKATGFSMQSTDLSYTLFGNFGSEPAPEGCGVWYTQPSPNPEFADDVFLNDIAYLAPDDIWAVGRASGEIEPGNFVQQTVAMHFDGEQWSLVPTPNPTPVPELMYCELNAIAALAPDNIWAAGTRVDTDGGAGYVGTHNLVIHWDGTSWEHVEAPIPPTFGAQGVSGDGIYEILAIAPDDIWFLGEWITLNPNGNTFRYALAMHYDGSDFTVSTDMPIVGGNGATIYASDYASSDDIWAAGAAGDGDPATTNFSYIYHWNGSTWEHRPFTPAPGYNHGYGGVKVLAPNDVWISGWAWAPAPPGGESTTWQYMLHWNGSGYEYIDVPFAGGPIVGEPPAMYIFGSGGVTLFDGETFTDAKLTSGLEFLTSYGFGGVVQTGECEMIAAGFKWIAGDARSLIAQLVPLGGALAFLPSPDINGDMTVDGADLGLLLASWDTTNTWADLDMSGTVDGADLGILLGAWTE